MVGVIRGCGVVGVVSGELLMTRSIMRRYLIRERALNHRGYVIRVDWESKEILQPNI